MIPTAAALIVTLVMAVAPGGGADLSGRLVSGAVPVPGATVTATRGDRTVTATSDEDGAFRLANLDDGDWKLKVDMRGFVPASRDITLPLTEPLTLALTMQAFADIVKAGQAGGGPPDSAQGARASGSVATVTEPPPDDPGIINGSSINGAASPFGQPRAFGNNRPKQRGLYTGSVNSTLANSAWNASPYSFSHSNAPTPDTSNLQLNFTLGGPLRIPWLLKYGPNMTLSLQHGVQHSAITQSALMPTPAERLGDFSQAATPVIDPRTGLPFDGNVIPADRISSQATALLALYPLPNAVTTTGANFERPIMSTSQQDAANFGTNKAVSRKDTLNGLISFRRAVTDSDNLFGFSDRSRQSSLNTELGWQRRFSLRLQSRLRYQFSRASNTVLPFFANRVNVSGDAGIAGNEQSAVNWGPPLLSFPDIATLTDAAYQRSVTITHVVGEEMMWRHGRHNITFGGDLRATRVDTSSQPDPRGSLSFTGVASGSPFADFLLGLPSTSSIAFATTATHLRGNSLDAYVNDDFHLAAGLTLNAGLRWEYDAPFTETAGRLVNLDVAPGFTAVSPVLALNPVGAITGASFPTSLLRPDKHGFEPRIATSWRPILADSLVFKGSYTVYRNLGAYQPLASLLAKQPPLSNTFSVQNNALTPLTLANPFPTTLPTNANTFAIDPNFREGFAHAWEVSAQRDFPASLTVIAAYLGTKGTHLMQAFLPNTLPPGSAVPASAAPTGFVFITANGDSLRNAFQFTLRRRLAGGFTATAQYTLSKSTDDAATFSSGVASAGSLAVAQNWLDLSAERGPSSFDQRHVFAGSFQYTTGVGLTGGTLVDGWKGRLLKDWTIDGRINVGSGLPFTPVSFLAIAGTGFVGIRPSVTGVSPNPVAPGSYANPAAFTTPLPGTWGDAGRNSIRGPGQFSFDMNVARTFRLHGQMRLTWRIAVINLLNHVTFTAINTVVGSPQFGLPTATSAMRRVQTTFVFAF